MYQKNCVCLATKKIFCFSPMRMILYTFTIDQCGNKTLHRFMKAHLPNQTTHEGGKKKNQQQQKNDH